MEHRRVVFLHIPKTGGTTLHRFLTRQFREEDICRERSNSVATRNNQELARYRLFSGHFDRTTVDHLPTPIAKITLLRNPRDRIISLYRFWRSHSRERLTRSGHKAPLIAKELPLLEFLRWQSDGVPESIDNVQVRSLLGSWRVGPAGEYYRGGQKLDPAAAVRCAEDYLDSLDTFGLTERMPQSVRIISAVLGYVAPMVVKRSNDHREFGKDGRELKSPADIGALTPEIDAELDRLTQTDQALYEHAERRFEEARLSFFSTLRTVLPRRRRAQTP